MAPYLQCCRGKAPLPPLCIMTNQGRQIAVPLAHHSTVLEWIGRAKPFKQWYSTAAWYRITLPKCYSMWSVYVRITRTDWWHKALTGTCSCIHACWQFVLLALSQAHVGHSFMRSVVTRQSSWHMLRFSQYIGIYMRSGGKTCLVWAVFTKRALMSLSCVLWCWKLLDLLNQNKSLKFKVSRRQ